MQQVIEARALELAGAYCRKLEQLDLLSGNVWIGHRGRVLQHQSYGQAVIEHAVQNTPDGVFRVGSITKQFTAAAVLLLEEQGLLQIEDTVAVHWPDYPNGDRITIVQLLNHTSGIPNITAFPEFEKIMCQSMTLEENITLFKDRELAFEPGEKFAYSNSGYILLSYLVERVSGIPFETFMEERIWKPLGMSRSGLENSRKLVMNRVSGYEVWGSLVPASYIDMSLPTGAGAMIATTEDLYRWDQALHGGRLIAAGSYKKMVSPGLGRYGLGLFINEEEIDGRTRRIIGHGGGINGFRAEYRRYADEELTIIVLCNRSVIDPGAIADKLGRIMLGEEVAIPEAHAPIVLTDVPFPMEGEYAEVQEGDGESESGGMKITIGREGEQWMVQSGNRFKFELLPYRSDSESVQFGVKYMPDSVTIRTVQAGMELIADMLHGPKRFIKG
jgi:CubicO group peptidase (beta-lactamase class C family)